MEEGRRKRLRDALRKAHVMALGPVCLQFISFWALMHIVLFSLLEVFLNPFPDVLVFYFADPLFCLFKQFLLQLWPCRHSS